jgi:hypothetical protein
LTATNAHQYRQVPSMPRDSGLSFIRSSNNRRSRDVHTRGHKCGQKFSHRLAYETQWLKLMARAWDTVAAKNKDRFPQREEMSVDACQLFYDCPQYGALLQRCRKSFQDR